jgi:hypothetical protein
MIFQQVMEIPHQQSMPSNLILSSGNIDAGTIKIYGIKGNNGDN